MNITHKNQTLKFAAGLSLRTFARDGKPWFLANDVCLALGITNVGQAVGNSVAPNDQSQLSLGVPGYGALVVNESGLYALIMRSTKTAAKPFQKWVTGAILPALVNDGVYIEGQENFFADDLTLTALLAQMAEIQSKVDALKAAKMHQWAVHQEAKNIPRNTPSNSSKGTSRRSAN